MNNNNNLEKFIEDIESIKMTQYEKNEMRQQLASFAVNYEPTVSPYSIISIYTKRILATAFIAIISIGSLSQTASNDALPGDTLYPVKIAHENFKIATTGNETKKINYEISRTEKRIQEAAKLAQEDKLDTETQQEIAQVIKKQAQKVQEQIETVKEEDPESALKLNSELKSTIKANSEVLRKVTTKKQETKTEEIINEDTQENTNSIENSIDDSEDIAPKESQTNEEISIDNETDNIVDAAIDEKESTPTDNLDIPEIIEESTLTTESEDLNPTEEDIIEIETSFAETLLESLEEEVEIIEAFEEKVEQEIIQEEIKSLEDEEVDIPVIVEEEQFDEEIPSVDESEEVLEPENTEETLETSDSVIDIQTEKTPSVDESEEVLEPENTEETLETSDSVIDIQTEEINNEISSLQDILLLKEEINEIKLENEYTANYEIELVDSFNEVELAGDIEVLIQEKKYKQAFIKLQEIKEFYQEEMISENAEKTLGITTEEKVELQEEVTASKV